MAASLQTRFRILDRPLRHPGKCAVCGSATKPVVDMGITIPGYGVPYFCVEDLADLASAIGMVSESDVSELRLAAEQSFDAYLTKRELKVVTNEWYSAVSTGLGDLFARVHGIGFYSGTEDRSAAGNEVSEDAGQSDDNPHDSADSDESVAEQDDNSPVDEGPASVSAGSSDGNSGDFTF